MKILKKTKIAVAVVGVSFALSSCSTGQMMATSLAISGTFAAVGLYDWASNPDATAVINVSSTKAFQDVQNTFKTNTIYKIVSATPGDKDSHVEATTYGKTVKVVIENVGDNQSKIYIDDARGKDNAKILLNQIIANTK